MNDDATTESGQPIRPSKRGFSRTIKIVLITVGVVTAVVVGVPVVYLATLLHQYSREPVIPVTNHVASMPCVTWATGSTGAGGESTGPGGDIQVGLSKSCTAAQISDVYDYVKHAFTHTRLYAFDFFVTPSSTGTRQDAASKRFDDFSPTTDNLGNSSGGVFDGITPTTIAQLDIGSTIASTVDIRRAASHWLTLQRDVDPNAQVTLGEDHTGSHPIEYLQANVKQNDLPRLRETLLASLRAHPWSVTVDAHAPDSSYRGANSTARTAATISSNSGFPTSTLVDLAVAASNGFGDAGYVLVTSGTIQELAENDGSGAPTTGTWTAPPTTPRHDVALRIFGMRNPTEVELTGSPAWPAITRTIDALDVQGVPFLFGVGFFGENFSIDPFDPRQDTGIDLRGNTQISVLDSALCGKAKPTGGQIYSLVTPDPVVRTLSTYWLAPTRERGPDSIAGSCS
ncbi:hypothetical protein [Frondihabitans cladoniiphilus]|uniref:Uncharacterized protein n=1 Tax=Frondihabitans cladoniiphilus TaxID=715785 RepID=A0ABP8WAJ5_9MICO